MVGPELRRRVGILFAQFAPYHVDRCVAAARALTGHAAVDAVEVASASVTYAWEPSGDVAGVTKHTLFPDARFEAIGRLSRLRAMWRVLRRCRTIFIGISYAEVDIALLAFALKLTGHRVVLMTESKFDDKPRRVATELLKALLLLPYVGAIVGGARQIAYVRFLGFRRRPIWTGYDTVDMARVRALAPSPSMPFADRAFIFVGRFVAKKNVPFLIDAYSRYAALAGDAARPLSLIGSGDEEPAIRAAIARHGLADQVRIEGFLQAGGVASALSRALALLLPSTEEQWGLVVNEALAFDLPVIVSHQVGSREALVRNCINGFVIDAQDVEGWAEAMLVLSADETRWTAMSRASASLAPAGDTARFAEAVSAMVQRFG